MQTQRTYPDESTVSRPVATRRTAKASLCALLVLLMLFGSVFGCGAKKAGSDAAAAITPAETPLLETTPSPVPTEAPTPEPTEVPLPDGTMLSNDCCLALEGGVSTFVKAYETYNLGNLLVPIYNAGEDNLYIDSDENAATVTDTDGNDYIKQTYHCNLYPAVIRPGETGYISCVYVLEQFSGDTVVIEPKFDFVHTTSDPELPEVSDVKVHFDDSELYVLCLLKDADGKILSHIEIEVEDSLDAGDSTELTDCTGTELIRLVLSEDDVAETEVFVGVEQDGFLEKGTVDAGVELPKYEAPLRALTDIYRYFGEGYSSIADMEAAIAALAPTATTITVDGSTIDVFEADVSELSYANVGEWSSSQRVISNSRSWTYLLKGVINDCYGVTMYVENESTQGNAFSVPWRALVRLQSGSWSHGDDELGMTFSSKGGNETLSVLFLKPQTFSEFVVVPVSMTNGDWSTSTSYGVRKLYFATREACQAYIDSVR